MSDDKKRSIILVVFLSLIVLALIGFLVYDKLKEKGTITNSEVKQIMKDFDKYYTSKEEAVIFYASSSCGWCSLQKPILETIAEDYDMDYLYIDITKLGAKQKEEITKKLDIGGSTPTTVIVKNSKVIDVAEGFTDGRDYVEFFASNDVIPEDAVYSKDNNITYVDIAEYKKITSDGKTHLIVVGQTTCSHCINVKPALNSIAKDYNLTVNYINVNTLSQDDYNVFSESLKTMEYNDPDYLEDGSFGTPLMLIVKNGKIDSYISGERTKSQLVREFKKAGLIKE